ncbi:MAG: hypothetical protein ACK4VY_10505 [Brevundimonas sp.]
MTGAADVLEVARFSTIPEAELAASFLQQHGVRAWLPDRDMATMNPDLLIAIGGVRVVTTTGQIVEARQLIARMRAGEFVDEAAEEAGDWRIDHTPGKVGDLHDEEISGVMGWAKKTGAIVVILAFVVFPLAGCLMTAFGG